MLVGNFSELKDSNVEGRGRLIKPRKLMKVIRLINVIRLSRPFSKLISAVNITEQRSLFSQ